MSDAFETYINDEFDDPTTYSREDMHESFSAGHQLCMTEDIAKVRTVVEIGRKWCVEMGVDDAKDVHPDDRELFVAFQQLDGGETNA